MAQGVDKLLNAARSAERRGDPVAAQRAYMDVLERFPGNTRARAALAALDQALIPTYQALSPPYAELTRLVGLFESGQHAEAMAFADQLLAHFPECHFVHSTRGAIARALGDGETAVAAFLEALAIKPDFVDAHYNLATTYEDLGKHEDAHGFYVRALALQPDRAAWLTRLGLLYAKRLDHDGAIRSFERALVLDPSDLFALYALAEQQRLKGLPAEAIANYERAVSLAPWREDWVAALEATRAIAGVWTHPDALQAARNLGLSGRVLPNHAMLGIDPDPARALVRARTTARAMAALAGEVTALIAPEPASDGRLRIGYFSADFHNHATMYLMQGLFREHDRSRFEIHAYSYGATRTGDRRAALCAMVDGFHDVLELSDQAVVELARGHALDLAIDLKGYTAEARTGLFALRLAPVQAQWLGYPGTMGADFIDYLVADPVVLPPEERAHYSEAVIHLPGSYQPNDNQREIAATPPSRKQCGLPPAGLVFCSFNHVWKIGPDEFDVWMDLLKQVPGSVLWLLKSNSLVSTNLRREAAARGVDPDRLVFAAQLPHAEHLARMRHADLFLDSFTCNAHTTASDALWAGVPVLTCAGSAFPARVAASLLVAAGLPELVTPSRADYAALALALATDPARLADLRARLAAQRETCALFDTAAHTRAIEAAWTAVIERARAGLPPEDIAV